MTCPACDSMGVCPEHDIQAPAKAEITTQKEGALYGVVRSSRGGGDAPAAELDLEEFASEVRQVCAQMRGIEPPAEVVERAKRIPCTCMRLDVDLYDTTGCEACGDEQPYEELCRRCHDWPCHCLRDEMDAEDEAVADEDCGAFVQGGGDVLF